MAGVWSRLRLLPDKEAAAGAEDAAAPADTLPRPFDDEEDDEAAADDDVAGRLPFCAAAAFSVSSSSSGSHPPVMRMKRSPIAVAVAPVRAQGPVPAWIGGVCHVQVSRVVVVGLQCR